MSRKSILITILLSLIFSGSRSWSFQGLERGEHQWLEFHLVILGPTAGRENGAPDGESESQDFELSTVKFYVLTQVHHYPKLEVNAAAFNESDLELVDAVLQFEYSDFLNDWAGRSVFTLEGAYYDYDVAWTLPNVDGDGFCLTLGWLFPRQMWLDQLRPVIQCQEFSPFNGSDQEKWEWGCPYLSRGHFAKVVALFTSETWASFEGDSVLPDVQFWC